MPIQDWPLDQIRDNPFNTRTVFDEAAILDLAEDIRQRGGLLQVPIGCPSSTHRDGRWQNDAIALAFGHRRLRAYRRLHADYPDDPRWATMPVDVRDLDQQSLAVYAWSENAHRKDIGPLEEAEAIARMIEHFKWSQEEVARRLGIARPTVSNKLRLLKLPKEARTMLAAGQLSERQASALLPLADLPPMLVTAAEKYSSWHTPAKIIEDAPACNSDAIRTRISQMVSSVSERLDVPWAGHSFEDAKHYQARNCGECAGRVRLGDEVRCPDKACHAKKAESWRALRLAQASASTGLPIHVGTLEYDVVTHFAADSHAADFIAAGCPNQRVASYAYGLHPDGFDDVSIVCAHGKGGYCKCLRKAKAAATRADPDRQAEREIEKRILAEALAPAQRAVREAIERGDIGVWLALLDKIAYGSSGKVAHDLAAIREQMAAHLLKWYGNANGSRDSVEHARSTLEKDLAALDVPAPWASDAANYLAERVRRIEHWLWYSQDLVIEPAVRGNLANLAKLSQQLVELGPDLPADLGKRISHLQDALTRILDLYRRYPPDRWTARAAILGVRLTASQEWAQALDEAEPHELEYALCQMHRDGDGRARIQARLAELQQAEAPA